MLYLVTALYAEAKPFLALLPLKKNTSFTHSTVYENERLTLLITGTGKLSAAIALTELLALRPPSAQDLLCNIGSCACAEPAARGRLFWCNRITDAATGRTVYPDLLFSFPYEEAALVTADTVLDASGLDALTTAVLGVPAKVADAKEQAATRVLCDMEGYGIYTAALHYFSCDRILFFKAVSDSGIRNREEAPAIDTLLAAHAAALLPLLFRAEATLSHKPPVLSVEAEQLLTDFAERFSFSASMKSSLRQLILYGALRSIPVERFLTEQLQKADLLPSTKTEGKKQLAFLKQELLQTVTDNLATSDWQTPVKESAFPALKAPFSHIYIEKDVETHPLAIQILSRFPNAVRIPVSHYKDVFNRSRQDSMRQKQAPALILAAKHGTLLYPGAPVCQSFGNAHFYYTSCTMNCPYDCEYCYLQGMYPSSDLVQFVNLEDYFAELDALLAKHPVYLCASYDTDLLALNGLNGIAGQFASYLQKHENLTIELRTKSANLDAIRTLPVSKRLILAWTLSPESVIQTWEHKTPSLSLRLKAARLAKDRGFPVRLCFDPLLWFPDFKAQYRLLFDQVFSVFSPDELFDISLGVFRCSKDFIKLMRKKRPASALLQYPYENENGVYHYGAEKSEALLQTIKALLLSYQVPEEKLFLWEP